MAGFNESTGQVQMEINGLVEPQSDEAKRIYSEDINEVIADLVQDKQSIERGVFTDPGDLVPEEITTMRAAAIVRKRYPELSEQDVEAIRQRAVAAFVTVQKAKAAIVDLDNAQKANTALIDGIRKFAMDVRDLDIDLIDHINPFGEAYSILGKAMNAETFRQVQTAIAGRRTKLTPEEAKAYAIRAVKFKREHGRSPTITAADAFERLLAEGAAAFTRFDREGKYERG